MKVAICGKICSGKSTLTDKLMERYPKLIKKSFAGKIKELAVGLFGMKEKDRKLLQDIGNNMRLIDPYIDFGKSIYEIKEKILKYKNIDLNEMEMEIVKRETEKNFRMKYHRDNFMVRNIEGKLIFIPFSNTA